MSALSCTKFHTIRGVPLAEKPSGAKRIRTADPLHAMQASFKTRSPAITD
ncbi:hypothetical protein SynROS8604_01211 [Synechococcus sp. ROS8604]|nr:hypothetical protein SynROS8604_01211 [Synechococcus sp. ROS8604]